MDSAQRHRKFYQSRRTDDPQAARGNEDWLQRLTASALAIGIGKKALFSDYYFDELEAIFRAWGEMHGVEGEGEAEEVPMTAFFGV